MRPVNQTDSPSAADHLVPHSRIGRYTRCRVNADASLLKYSTGLLGCFVSGVSTPIRRTRSPVPSMSVSPSTTRWTYSKSAGEVTPWSGGFARAANSATMTSPGIVHFQEASRQVSRDTCNLVTRRSSRRKFIHVGLRKVKTVHANTHPRA